MVKELTEMECRNIFGGRPIIIFYGNGKYKDTVLISKKKELRKINCRHFVFLYVFSLMGASRPLAPRCFQV